MPPSQRRIQQLKLVQDRSTEFYRFKPGPNWKLMLLKILIYRHRNISVFGCQVYCAGALKNSLLYTHTHTFCCEHSKVIQMILIGS